MFVMRKNMTSNEQKLRRLISNEIKTIVKESIRPRRTLASLIFEDADPTKIDPERFPTTLSGAEKKGAKMQYVVTGGNPEEDEKKDDDVIKVADASFPCGDLKPSQSSMNIDKAVGMALGFVVKNNAGGKLGAFISEDGFIMDGHHRWISTFMVDPSAQIIGYKVNLPGEKLVAVLNAYTAGKLGHTGKPATGGFEQFKNEDAMKKAIEKVVAEGVKGKDDDGKDVTFVTSEQAAEAVKTWGGDVDGTAKKFMENLSGATMTTPGWAPERPDMPVIEKGDIEGAISALNNGEIDVNPPYFEDADGGEDKDKGKSGKEEKSVQKAGYHRSGTVIVERWQKLAGIIK